MNAEALNSAQIPDPAVAPPVRLKRHLAGIATGFLIPFLLVGIAWQPFFPSYKRSFFLMACVPLVFVGFFVSCRSWRRWFHPDRLPVRWAEDSVWFKRVKVLEWVTGGVNIVAWLGIAVMSAGEEHWSHKARPLWLAAMASASFRVILMQYREDRKPLPPLSSPRDLSQLSTDSIKPVYSKDWDRIGEP